MNILITSLLRRRLGSDVTASRARLIYNLAEGLIKRGHSVSLLAPGTSTVPGATIIPSLKKALFELPPFENQFYTESAYLVVSAKLIQEYAPHFDIVHNHSFPEYINLLVEETLPVPMVTTLHTPYTSELEDVLAHFPKAHIVAQSEGYRKLVKKMNIPWVVPCGIDINLFNYSEKLRTYLLWIGRLGFAKDADGVFIDGKGVRDAIAVARQTGRKLKLIGNIEDREFYNQEVTPYLSENIEWLSPFSSEQSHAQEEVSNLIQGAKALLFTTKFEESFGLVAAEAMACGTLVVGYARGSLTDIVEDGKTGYLVNPAENIKRGDWSISKTGVDGLSEAVERLYSLSGEEYLTMQKAGRARVEQYFTLDTMVANYEALYKKLTGK